MFANCEGATDEDWQIVLDNMGLVYHCLNRMGGFFTDRDREDAEQDGIFGLLRAAQKYDPDTGFRFSTYAHAWIKQSIQRGRKNRGEHVDRNGRTVSDVLSLDHHQDGTASSATSSKPPTTSRLTSNTSCSCPAFRTPATTASTGRSSGPPSTGRQSPTSAQSTG